MSEKELLQEIAELAKERNYKGLWFETTKDLIVNVNVQYEDGSHERLKGEVIRAGTKVKISPKGVGQNIRFRVNLFLKPRRAKERLDFYLTPPILKVGLETSLCK